MQSRCHISQACLGYKALKCLSLQENYLYSILKKKKKKSNLKKHLFFLNNVNVKLKTKITLKNN